MREFKKRSKSGQKQQIYIPLKNMDTEKARKILAKSLYRKLVRNGFTNQDIVNLSKEILDHVAHEMCKKPLRRVPTKRSSIDRLNVLLD
ncbi:MAG: hypothetical protein LLG43_06135 [Deltaproteobacteria bacterium]|nr:hypothetical protein [Deltaproteobacteria bacterium]